MKKLIAILLCLLVSFPAAADIAYEPPYSSFYEKVQDQTERVERWFYTNGEKGYIVLRKAPGGNILQYVTNAERVQVYCFYKEWAMVTHLNQEELPTPGWVEQSALYLIYDEQAFQEEHAAEIQNGRETLHWPEEGQPLYIYAFPGAAESFDYSYRDEEDAITLSGLYTDPEGRRWGRIPYYRGIRRSWVCIDEPSTVIPPFGGDPNLALIQAQKFPASTEPELESDEPLDLPDHLIPAAEPPAFIFNPLPWFAVGLVVLAIATAIILLILCYKKKGK